MTTASEQQAHYGPGDEIMCYQNLAEEGTIGLHLDTATITGPREEWRGNPIESKYGYPIIDSMGRDGWVFEDQIINQ